MGAEGNRDEQLRSRFSWGGMREQRLPRVCPPGTGEDPARDLRWSQSSPTAVSLWLKGLVGLG